jgi:Domain of Unknown Function (DUF1259)
VKLKTICTILLLSTSLFAQNAFDWSSVENILGRKGSPQPGGVYKFGLPRTDLKVNVGDVQIKPALALGGWLAFEGSGEECMVMGDLVVAESEVPGVVQAAMAHDFAITAIHNHVLNETPRVMYMHVGGHFTSPAHTVCAEIVAHGMKEVIAAAHVPAAPDPNAVSLDIQTPITFEKSVETALNAKGKINGGVLQFAIPRGEVISMHGMPVVAAMGTATAINFQPVGGTRAAITGDFVMTAPEVPKVMKALQAAGIQPTALHSHMLDEEPRLFFMHFWAVDDAAKLAGALRGALDQMNTSAPNPPTAMKPSAQ